MEFENKIMKKFFQPLNNPIYFHYLLHYFMEINLKVEEFTRVNVEYPAVNPNFSFFISFLYICNFNDIYALLLHIKLNQAPVAFFRVINGVKLMPMKSINIADVAKPWIQ